MVIDCNTSFCRHAKVYPDGLVVNHAPLGISHLGGAINGQVDEETRLAAYTFLSWLVKDANQIEAVVSPPSWPNLLGLSIIRPSLLVPSLWKEHGWQDPAVSMFSTVGSANAEHPNAALSLRLPNAPAYLDALSSVVTSYLLATEDYQDLTDEEGAIIAAAAAKVRMQAVTDAGDLDETIKNYQKELGIYVEPEDQVAVRKTFEVLPRWAVWTVGTLGGILCLLLVTFSVVWLALTYLQRRRLQAKERNRMLHIIEDAESAMDRLCFPMAVIGAEDFIDLQGLVDYEILREAGKLRFLDSAAKIEKFKEECFIIVFSHQWLGWRSPDPSGTHFETMCSVVRVAAEMFFNRGDAAGPEKQQPLHLGRCLFRSTGASRYAGPWPSHPCHCTSPCATCLS